MIKTEPKIEDNITLSMRESASVLEISLPTLYKYEKMGLFKPHFRQVNGRKFLYGNEVKKLWGAEIKFPTKA